VIEVSVGDLCDLCDHGDEVIDRVERGATVIITRAGVPVSDSGVDVDQGQKVAAGDRQTTLCP